EELTVLPVGMIGCDGPTLTVRVFSSVEPSHITTLHADTDSHTSVALAQVVLWKKYGVRPTVIDLDARDRIALGGTGLDRTGEAQRKGSGPGSEWPETLLLIGDKVVADAPPAERYPYQIDLGEAWHEMTGLPFVYASWMCLAGAAESPEVK